MAVQRTAPALVHVREFVDGLCAAPLPLVVEVNVLPSTTTLATSSSDTLFPGKATLTCYVTNRLCRCSYAAYAKTSFGISDER